MAFRSSRYASAPTPIYTRGDAPDVLLAFNQEAYDAYIAELQDGGMLIYDPDRVTLDPDQASHFQTLAFPMGNIAAKELRMPIVKNVVAVGGLATLFGLETDHLKQVIRKLWLRKGEAVVETNHKALDAGIAYVNEQVNGAAPFVLAPATETQNTVHISGNQATGLGAIAGGVQFFAGYPITPASRRDGVPGGLAAPAGRARRPSRGRRSPRSICCWVLPTPGRER